MGIIVRMLSSGLGLASESIHAARSRSKSSSGRSPPPSPRPAVASSSSGPPSSRQHDELPPSYVEVTSDRAAQLVRSGEAEYLSDAKVKAGSSHLRPQQAARDDKHSYDNEDNDDEDDDSDGQSDSDVSETANITHDEAAWELDDMADALHQDLQHQLPPAYSEEARDAELAAQPDEVKVEKEELMIKDMVRMAGAPPSPAHRIPCPVIVPQRRPRQKDRGFVRAYAPVLAECGIGQDVFIKFLKDWHQASKASPWIDVVFIAAGIAGLAPEVFTQVVSTVVQVVAGTARELQSRHRRNTFLDRANDALFMPRGLYAMVMAFKDQVPGQQPRGPLSRIANQLGSALFTAQRLDINQTAAKYAHPDPDTSSMQQKLKDIRLTSGRTYGEVELPEAAALVYPDLDEAAVRDLEADEKSTGKGTEANRGTKDRWRSAGKFVQGYMDRRAQAFYEREHHGSVLAVPSSAHPQFASRFSDPNHPANSGSLIALLTGGALNPAARQQERRAAKRERRELKQEYKDVRREYKDERRMARGKAPRGPRRARRRDQRQYGPDGRRVRRPGLIRKIMTQDVLYLIVVNLPTQGEMAESVARLERVVTEQGGRFA